MRLVLAFHLIIEKCTFSESCSPASEYFVQVELSHRDILTYSRTPMKNVGSALSNLAHIFTKASNRLCHSYEVRAVGQKNVKKKEKTKT